MKEIRTSELDTTYIRLALCFACFLQYVFAVLLSRFLRHIAQVFQSISVLLLVVTWLYRQGRWSLIAALSIPHVAVPSFKGFAFTYTTAHIARNFSQITELYENHTCFYTFHCSRPFCRACLKTSSPVFPLRLFGYKLCADS
jgi:hypothetical protein